MLLTEARHCIDDIDFDASLLLVPYFCTETHSENYQKICSRLSELFADRMKLTAFVGLIKAEYGIETLQQGRAYEVRQGYIDRGKYYSPDIDSEEFSFLFDLIHFASVAQQEQVVAQYRSENSLPEVIGNDTIDTITA